jgi:hypothetical protein
MTKQGEAGLNTLWRRAPFVPKRARSPAGICAKCGNSVVGLLRLAPGLPIAFVPSQNFPRPAELPAPDRHIVYDRRVADVADAVPKLEGYWASEAHVTRTVFAGLFQRRGAA